MAKDSTVTAITGL